MLAEKPSYQADGHTDPRHLLAALDQVELLLNNVRIALKRDQVGGEPLDRVAAVIAAARRLRWCIARSVPGHSGADNPEAVLKFPS